MSDKTNDFAIADELFTKAQTNLEAAKYLFKGSYLEGAISRAYYAVFHAARAILLLLGERPRSHEGTLQLFGLRVVKSGLVDSKSERIFRILYQNQQTADYAIMAIIEESETNDMINKAEEFLKEMKELNNQIKRNS